MKYVAEASKNTSPLPDLLAESSSTDEITRVLRIVAEEGNEDYARQLAQAILASETAEGVNNAFASIAEQAESAGVQDPEELLRIKLNSTASRFVGEVGMRLGAIKKTFNDESTRATSRDGVLAAYDKSEAAAIQLMNTVEQAMADEILTQYPSFDLEPYRESI